MSIEKTDLWRAALAYVAQGYRVIPIAPNAKTPLLRDWENTAISDPATVDAVWGANPDANIAFCPEHAGLAIIDCDPGADATPLELPATREIETPRGGSHHYYIGSVAPTVGRLGEHIDTRGQRSYALMPPSVVDGKPYRVKRDVPAVALPDAIQTRLASRDLQAKSSETRTDLPGNIATARTRLLDRARRGAVAISGRGGNSFTYGVVAELVRDLGISPELSLTLLEECWNPHCQPPWSRAELQDIIAHVCEYGQNEVGAYATANPQETFKNANLEASAGAKEPRPLVTPSKFKMLGTKEQNELPEPTWLLKDVVPEGRIVLMSAQKGHFKTFLALDIALSIAANKESFGVTPEHDGVVVYSAHESLEEIARLHRPAWFAVKAIEQSEETGFYLTEGLHVGFEGEREAFEEACDQIALAAGRPLRLVIIDTYSAAMASLDENNPTDVTNFIAWCRGFLARHPGCSLMVVAHKGKDAERGTRGSSALEYGLDTVLDIERIDNGMQVKVKVRRHRGAPERPSPFHFEARPVAKSLVFHLLSPEERDALAAPQEMYSHARVTDILRLMGAVNDEQAVTTRALACNMAPQDKGESDERYEARTRELELKLRRYGRSSLQTLTYGSGEKMRWCLPPEETPKE